ncbi:hypothetical protein GCM10007276_24110 [Agaricicola taiwanensis]|uniref:Tripartite tricarboxylate transporter substrate binding protein n=1 Tax=Agaricicola taiwanensis TaxID=591372 RepID=A0A8J3DW50_9RHOB|nr:tripartite tricarboxylate transporter substrate-binding protein [Agaricicola taiwanensis]GGE46105.1 hypothetical protein GCM10007276_24110 [Agaricicola taiwanensis]
MRIISYAAAAILALTATAASAQFPEKVVTVVVGYTPGGSNDKVGRHIADGLKDTWGQPVIVENRPGAGGAIGAAHVSQAAPDGHTLMVGPVTITMIESVQANLPYDLDADFTPVAMLGQVPMVLAVGPSVPAKSVKEFLEIARSKTLHSGTTGVGAIDHFASVLLMESAGIKLETVNYKGGTDAMIDLIGGHVDMYFGSLTQLMQQIRAGKLTAIAVTGDKRSDALPDTPTFAEAGLQGMDVQQWWAIFAPKKTPDAVIEKINADINAILESDGTKAFFAQDGAYPDPMEVQELKDFVKSESEKWQKIAKQANMAVQ